MGQNKKGTPLRPSNEEIIASIAARGKKGTSIHFGVSIRRVLNWERDAKYEMNQNKDKTPVRPSNDEILSSVMKRGKEGTAIHFVISVQEVNRWHNIASRERNEDMEEVHRIAVEKMRRDEKKMPTYVPREANC